jgi:cell division septum initiation protein DivIVA
MAEQSGSGASSPSFGAARRGYDRDQVDAFVRDLSARLAAVEADRNRLAAELQSLGALTPEAQRARIEEIGTEVDSILAATQAAADKVSARAADDAARWRAEADAAVRQMREDGQADAVALRQSAWDTASQLLNQAQAEAEHLVASAAEDVLLMRAQSEQEAHRLVNAGRRDVEEANRQSRLEAERMVAAARAESEGLIAAAMREVKAAEDRIEQLEGRNRDLASEMNERGTRTADDALATRPPTGVSQEGTVRVVPGTSGGGHYESWIDPEPMRRQSDSSEGTGGAGQPSKGIDALEIAAEVEEMRRSRPSEEPGARAPSAPARSRAPEPKPRPVIEPAAPRRDEIEDLPDLEVPEPAATPLVAPADTPQPDPEARPEPESPAVASAAPIPTGPALEPVEPASELQSDAAGAETEAAGPVPTDSGALPTVDVTEPDTIEAPPLAPEEATTDEATAAEATAAEATVQEEAAAPVIDDLFASLRGGAPAPASQIPAPDQPSEPVAAVQREDPSASVLPLRVDPFILRDRLLLPTTNRALREVKRVVVDLQNLTLEDIRTAGDDWAPDVDAFAAALRPPLEVLAAESVTAGIAAAAEVTGSARPADVASGSGVDAAAEMAAELGAALGDAVARATGLGPRQTTSAVSRVFRSWRTDEAERRLRNAAYRSYNAGLLPALATAGVHLVEARPSGLMCAVCPAAEGVAWEPGEKPPAGSAVPPAELECACAVVPPPG